MTRIQFNILMMEAAESPEALVHVQPSTHFLTEYIILHSYNKQAVYMNGPTYTCILYCISCSMTSVTY
jgi:hypothetical protein